MSDTHGASLPRPDMEFVIGACRAWRSAAAVAGLVMLAAALLALLLTPKYAATSALVLLLGPEYGAQVNAGQSSVTTAVLDRDEVVKSELEILGGAALHEAVIRRIGLARLYPDALDPPGLVGRALAAVGDALAGVTAQLGLPAASPPSTDPVRKSQHRFDRHLDILALKDGNVIEVTFRHPDAEVAAATVNTLIALYLQRRTGVFVDPQSHLVAERMQAALADVEAADAALARFKAAHGISSFEPERDLALHRRDDAARSAMASSAQADQLRQRLAVMDRQLAAMPDALEFYHDTDMAGRITNVKATVEALRARQSELLTHYQPDSQPALDLARQIAEQSAALRDLLRDRSATSDRIGRNPSRDAIALDRDHVLSDLAAATAGRDAALADIAALDATLRDLDASEPELLSLMRRRAVLEDNFRALSHLMQERQMIEAAQARAAAAVRVIEAATPPPEPHRLALPILIGGAFLALLAAAAVVAAREVARRTFLSPARLERMLQLPVLASVPDLSAAGAPSPRR
jgi:uncharacterized protein involved in exopolysaccharide biosynthesis